MNDPKTKVLKKQKIFTQFLLLKAFNKAYKEKKGDY